MRIQTIPQAKTLQAAFQHFNMPKARYEELAILNEMQLTEQLNSGTLIKVVGK